MASHLGKPIVLSEAGVDKFKRLAAQANTWHWRYHDIKGSVTLIAEGLTEAECRHISGLPAADAIAWCERRTAAQESK